MHGTTPPSASYYKIWSVNAREVRILLECILVYEKCLFLVSLISCFNNVCEQATVDKLRNEIDMQNQKIAAQDLTIDALKAITNERLGSIEKNLEDIHPGITTE